MNATWVSTTFYFRIAQNQTVRFKLKTTEPDRRKLPLEPYIPRPLAPWERTHAKDQRQTSCTFLVGLYHNRAHSTAVPV